MNAPGYHVGAEGTSMRRRRTVVALIWYCGIIVMLWLLPVMARHLPCDLTPCRFLRKGWLQGARAVARTVADAVAVPAAARGTVIQIGSLCVLGVLGLPFLGAFLSRSSDVRIILLALGALIAIIFVYLEVFGFLFWEGFPTG